MFTKKLLITLVTLTCGTFLGESHSTTVKNESIKSNKTQPRPPFATSARYLSHQKLFEGLERHYDIVFLGDSITNAGRWSEAFPNKSVANRGISGGTSKGILNRLDHILKLTPDVVYLMFGVNDIKRGGKADELFKRYKEIVNVLVSNNIKVVIQSTLLSNRAPWNIQINTLNEKLEQLSKENSYQYIDLNKEFAPSDVLTPEFSYDGVHLKAEVYLQWFELLRGE